MLDLWRFAEDLDQAVRNELLLAVFELPDCKTETVWVAGVAMAGAAVIGRRAWIPPAHAARPRSHAADPEWSGVSQFLHDLLAGDVEFRPINVPAVTRGYVAERLRIKLPRQRRHSEL